MQQRRQSSPSTATAPTSTQRLGPTSAGTEDSSLASARDAMAEEQGLGGGQASAAGQAGSAPGGGDDAPVDLGVLSLIPGLAQLLDTGLVSAFELPLTDAVESWVEGQLPGEGFSFPGTEDLLFAADTLQGVVTGDPDCCLMFETTLHGLTQAADTFIRAESALAQGFDGSVADIEGWLKPFLGVGEEGGLLAAIGGVVGDAQRMVDGAITAASLYDETLGDWITAQLGLEGRTLSELFLDGLGALQQLGLDAIDAVLTTLGDVLFSLPGLEALYRVNDFARELIGGTSWLVANWGAEDFWAKVGGELQTEMPQFAELLLGIKGGWDGLTAEAQEAASATLAAIDSATAAATGVPLASALTEALAGLAGQVDAFFQSPFFAEIQAGFEAAGDFALARLGDLGQIAAFAFNASINPLAIPSLLAAAAFREMPSCYKAPIFDALITCLATVGPALLGPLLAEVPGLAAILQPVILGALDGLQGLDDDTKIRYLDGFASLHDGTFTLQMMAGLLGGFLEGVLSGAWGTLTLIRDIVGLFDLGQWALWLAETAVVVGSDALDAIGDHHFQEDAHAPIESAPEPAAEQALPEPGTEIGGGDAPEMSEPTSLEQLFGGEIDAALAELSTYIQGMAGEFVEMMISTLEAPFSLGRTVGYGAGLVTFEILLAFATAGLGPALEGGKLALQGLRAALFGAKGLGPAIRFVGTWLDDLIKLIAKLPIPGMDEMVKLLRTKWDELVELLTGGAKAGPKPKPKPKKGKGDKKGEEGKKDGEEKKDGDDKREEEEEEDDKDPVKRQARRAAAALDDEANAKLRPVRVMDAVADRFDKAGEVDVSFEAGEKGTVVAEGLGPHKGRRASRGDYFKATDDSGGVFFGGQPFAKKNADLLDELFEDLEDHWMEEDGPDGAWEADAARASLFDLAEDLDQTVAKRVPYRTGQAGTEAMKVETTVGAVDAARESVEVRAVISPNAAVKEDTLTRDTSPDVSVRDAVKAAGGILPFLVAMARDEDVGAYKAAWFDDASHPGGWGYVDPESNKMENKKYVKDRFRAIKKGQHEWIPCMALGKIVEGAHAASDAEKGARWMMLADEMRSDTSNLVFEPTVQAWLETDVVEPSRVAAEAAQEGQDGTDTRVRGEIDTRPIIADDMSVTGHVGALYMLSGGKARGRTKGTGDFHAGLRDLWSFDKDPAEYPEEVADYIADDGVGLWDGDPRKLLPVSFDPYAADVTSQFVSKGSGGSWGANLAEVMAEVGRRYGGVVLEVRKLQGKH